MSATYQANGFFIIKIPIDGTYQCSSSSTPDQITEVIEHNLMCKIGSFEIIDYKIKLEKRG